MLDSQITALLAYWRQGDSDAVEKLLPAVYSELRKIAAGTLARSPDPNLSRTELVHETFLRLAGGRVPEFANRKHFYAITAKLMRIVLVDQARHRRRAKRNGVHVRMDDVEAVSWNATEDHLALHHCLERLEAFSPRKAQIVELRFFGGLELAEIAEHLGISLALVKRELLLARAWMAKDYTGGSEG